MKKPADSIYLPRHEYSQMVNELRDTPDIQSKRERIITILKQRGIYPSLAV